MLILSRIDIRAVEVDMVEVCVKSFPQTREQTYTDQQIIKAATALANNNRVETAGSRVLVLTPDSSLRSRAFVRNDDDKKS